MPVSAAWLLPALREDPPRPPLRPPLLIPALAPPFWASETETSIINTKRKAWTRNQISQYIQFFLYHRDTHIFQINPLPDDVKSLICSDVSWSLACIGHSSINLRVLRVQQEQWTQHITILHMSISAARNSNLMKSFECTFKLYAYLWIIMWALSYVSMQRSWDVFSVIFAVIDVCGCTILSLTITQNKAPNSPK